MGGSADGAGAAAAVEASASAAGTAGGAAGGAASMIKEVSKHNPSFPRMRALRAASPLAPRRRGASQATITMALPHWVSDSRARAPTAFMPDEAGTDWADPPSTSAPSLSGVLLAVKDTFNVAGQATGFGNPAWRASHSSAPSTAPAVAALQAAGCALVGRTVCDELTYGLEGENVHYGAPLNPAAPGRTCGGSSCGSAAAVAGGAVGLALGSDTGGSVRLPASYCGVFGFRPSHGRVSLEGAAALAPSYDTAGWFAADAATLRGAGEVLLRGTGPGKEGGGGGRTPPPAPRLTRWLVGADAFDLATPAARRALYEAVAGAKERVAALLPGGGPTEVAVGGGLAGGLAAGAEAFRVTQAGEVCGGVGAWAARSRPRLGPTIAARLAAAAEVTPQEVAAGRAARAAVTAYLASLLATDGLLFLPAAPGPPPVPGSEAAAAARPAVLALTAPAGLAGLPQAVIPAAFIPGEGPVGLGLIGPAGSDEEVLRLAEAIAGVIGAGRGEGPP